MSGVGVYWETCADGRQWVGTRMLTGSACFSVVSVYAFFFLPLTFAISTFPQRFPAGTTISVIMYRRHPLLSFLVRSSVNGQQR